ncbi:MAG: hypothetical protein ACKVZ0_19755 [Gemmatimonadales bacterium]
MTVGRECLDADEAVELGELLEFVGRWLADDGERLAESLGRFVGIGGYDIGELCADLSRFAVLLGVDDGAVLGGDGR